MTEKACSGSAAWLVRPERQKALLCLAIVAVVAVAFTNRFYFLLDRGGLALDQQAWATDTYNGGITKVYLLMRDAILAWKAEAEPWPYLPGYPLFLAVLHAIGIKDLAFVRLAQTAIDSLAIFPLYFVLFRLGKSTYPAIFGCLIYAAAPWWSAGSTYLLAEALLPALVILLLAAMMLIRDHAARNLNWFLLGLLSSILPFFRSEMMLLFGPLALWALLVVPKGRRLGAVVCVVAGFAFPLILWTVRNYHVHGQFILTPPAKWYAAWAGLGQIGNDYGYFLSDARAIELLASKGIEFHSLDAESYWFREYLGAWINHPDHVVRTILFRLNQILGRIDNSGLFVSGFELKAYNAMAFITPLVLIWLILKRRTADAFLIAWPMLYALASLGILYVEQRYVRYAGLTYLLALTIILGKGAPMLLAMWPRQWRLVEPRQALSGVAVMGFLVLIAGTVHQLVFTGSIAQNQVVDRLNVTVPLEPTSALGNVAFRPAIPTVEFSRSAAGLELQANAEAGNYLLMAPTGARENSLLVVRYSATLRRGAIGFGVLSADSTQWLSHHNVAGEAGKAIEGTFTSRVQAGSRLVIDTQGAKPGVDVLISKLELTLVCPKPVNLFRLFFSKSAVDVSDCHGAQS